MEITDVSRLVIGDWKGEELREELIDAVSTFKRCCKGRSDFPRWLVAEGARLKAAGVGARASDRSKWETSPKSHFPSNSRAGKPALEEQEAKTVSEQVRQTRTLSSAGATTQSTQHAWPHAGRRARPVWSLGSNWQHRQQTIDCIIWRWWADNAWTACPTPSIREDKVWLTARFNSLMCDASTCNNKMYALPFQRI